VTQKLPFRVQRLQDPPRLVVDIASDTPVGGVATGLGGTAGAGLTSAGLAAGLAIVGALALAGVRRRAPRSRG
jgi:hypothetical protein